MDEYVSVILDQSTGLFKGARFLNHPTPSGAARYRINVSSDMPRQTVSEAIEDIATMFPDSPRIVANDLEIPPHLMPSLGSRVVVIRPKAEPRTPVIEERDPNDDDWRTSELSIENVEALIARGVLEMDTSSGDDPELSAIYDTYVVVRTIQNAKRAA